MLPAVRQCLLSCIQGPSEESCPRTAFVGSWLQILDRACWEHFGDIAFQETVSLSPRLKHRAWSLSEDCESEFDLPCDDFGDQQAGRPSPKDQDGAPAKDCDVELHVKSHASVDSVPRSGHVFNFLVRQPVRH